MASKQYMMAKLDQKFKLKIKYQKDNDITIVEAPLPEQFGFSVGSEFTAPFDASTLGGILQKLKVPLAFGVAKKVGVTTTKFYSNPEPTEISFDIEFHAEYSAREEVIEPIIALMCMSLGDALTFNDAMDKISEIRGNVESWINSTFDTNLGGDEDSEDGPIVEIDETLKERADGAMALIGLIQGPETTTIQFGNVFMLDNVWISSVSPQFSNVVDADGMPLSATVSVQAVIQRDPVVKDVQRFFGATPREQLSNSQREVREMSPAEILRNDRINPARNLG